MLQPPGSPSPWHREQAKGRSVGSQGCFRPRPCAPHWSESHAACALTIPLAQGGPWEREGEASFPLQDQNNPTHQHHGPPAPAPSHVTDSSFWRASGVWKEWLCRSPCTVTPLVVGRILLPLHKGGWGTCACLPRAVRGAWGLAQLSWERQRLVGAEWGPWE